MSKKPGEYVIENLMKTFIKISYNKIEPFAKIEQDITIRKGMKHNEDCEFQNLLQALNACAENSLPSLLKALLEWHSSNHSNKKALIKSKFDKVKLPDVCATLDISCTESGSNTIAYFTSDSMQNNSLPDSTVSNNVHLIEKRDLGVDYIFCQSVISVLKQLSLHPGHDEMLNEILSMAFKHFKYRDDLMANPNNLLINEIADLYADVVGVLAQNRFNLVKLKFTSELKSLKNKEVNSSGSQSIISLLMGMKFFRVKMYPMEDFLDCFNFLTELANYFLEVDDKKIKHALAGLFVEVLLPVAAVVKNEVNIPVLKNFVEFLYNSCLDMCSKKKHFIALSPLVTCLLSIGQKQFFLFNWPVFMLTCLGQLKNRDPNIARVALESLFRLLWVYIVRIKGEKHSDTQSKLHSIVNSLFPKGSKFVVPRDASINIFVKIIHFIAQEKLDFAMKEIIFDLIGANRSHKLIHPDRMNIGLCAFLLIALSLQQKEGEPPMPQKSNSESNNAAITCAQNIDANQATRSSPYHSSQVSNGRLARLSINKFSTSTPEWNSQSAQSKPSLAKRKTSYSFMTLNDTNAASLGIKDYINPVRKSFDTMLRLLDQQVIRTMLLTKQENINKEFDDAIPGQSICNVSPGSFNRKSKRNSVIDAERKPKIELLKTCISAIPRLLPAEMSKSELVELLSRLSIHIDEELRMMSQQALINIIQELPDWRFKTIQTYLQFVRKEISDSSPLQLESNMKILYHLINAWKNTLISATKDNNSKSKALDKTLLDDVEGFCLVMLCQYRSSIRRLSVHILKEVKALINQINLDLKLNMSSMNISQESSENIEIAKVLFAIDIIDNAAPKILEKCLPHLPNNEKSHLMMVPNIDFMGLAERTNPVWGVVSNTYSNNFNENHGSMNTEHLSSTNLWTDCIAIIFSRSFMVKSCPNALNNAWPLLMDRITHLFTIIDPSTQMAENRTSSLLRGGSSNKKPLSTNERHHCMLLWKNYITAACCIAPLSISQSVGLIGKYMKSSPDQSGLTMDSSQMKTISSNNSSSMLTSCMVSKPTSKDLLKILVPLIKCEVSELRDSVLEALGHFNPTSLRDMMDEIQYILRESVDKKQENIRRRKRKDSHRLYLVKILEYLAYNGIFDYSEEQLSQLVTVIDWFEQLKPHLIQSDVSVNMSSDTSVSILNDTRLHFCRLLQYIVLHAPKEKRQNLFSENFKQSFFLVIANWTGGFVKPLVKKKIVKNMELNNYGMDKKNDELCYAAITAMCSLICCGQIFDSQALQEDGYILPWLLNIINSKDEKLMALCEETITLLLDYNSDTHTFLDVMIDCCYTGTNSTMKIVFLSIVRTFNNIPDYPCDYISVIVLALVFTSNIDTQIKENAYQLLQLLYHRFFIDSSFIWSENNSILVESNSDPAASPPVTNTGGAGTKLSMISRWDQLPTMNQDEISKELSEMLPDLTLSVFSEITQRILTANPHLQLILLNCLVPWMYNIELIDFIYSSMSNANSNDSITQARSPRSKQYSSSPILSSRFGLIGNGWGSKQATDLVLNNLFYLTVRFGQELSKSLENIWACLINCRTENILVIIHYLIVITSLAPNSLLAYAKQVIVFLAKERPKKLLENLFSTLQTVDGINYSVERTQSLPFYRINNASNNIINNAQVKINSKPNSNTDTQIMDSNLNLNTHDKGVMNGSQQLPVASVRSSTFDGFQIPNKTQSGIINNDETSVANYPQSAPGTLRFDDLESTNIIIDEDKYATLRAKDVRKKDILMKQNPILIKSKDLSPNNIHPLPLPAYGGFSAPLNVFLTDEQCPIWTHSYKSSIVLMFFIDVVPIANTRSYWERDLELLLHCIILGLDHKECLVFEQCKFLLIKILQILCPEIKEFNIINLLMTGSTNIPTKSLLCLNGGACQSMIRMQSFDPGNNWDNISTDEPTKTVESASATPANDIDTKLQRTLSSYSVTSTVTLIPSAKIFNSQSKPNSCIVENLETCNAAINENNKNTSSQLKNTNVQELIKIICSCRDRPMWGYEDVTISRYINDGMSAINQLSTNRMSSDINSKLPSNDEDELILVPSVSVLNTIIKLICNLIDIDGTMVIKWAQLALNTGVNCTHRHYASRSLQIFRALGTTFDGTKLSALFSRLLDTIGDPNEDVQCYVVELFLTLECGIKNLNPQDMFTNVLDDNYSDTEEDDLYRSTPNLKNSFSSPKIGYHKDVSRQRGTTVGGGFRILNSSNHHQRASAVIESTTSNKQPSPRRPVNFKGRLKENKTAISSNLSWDERTDLVCELFWLANILMESELEHEFYAGIRFLTLLMNCLYSSNFDMRSKLEKTVQFFNWSSTFPGTIHLLMKGCFNSTFWHISAQLLSKMVLNVNCPLVDPTQKMGFPFTVLTLLVTIFDEENQHSRLAAKNIASIAKLISPDRLENLILVMQLYSGGTFNKDHTQWTRCVVKYLYDAYSDISCELLTFINRMLLECPSSMHNVILQVLCNFIYYINLNEPSVSCQLNKIIENLSQLFINTLHWKEVYPILRLIVSKSSSLTLPTSKVIESSVLLSLPMVPLPEAETPRLELPGRVLEYQFDVRGYCMRNYDSNDSQSSGQVDDANMTSKKSLSYNTKTKELLLQLINYFGTYGYRIGFPKSPSMKLWEQVIFSQSTETLEHQVSLHSSSETTSTNDISLADDLRLDETSSVEQAQVIRDLDEYLDSQLKMNFLDLPDNKWEDDRKPSWGVRSQSITHYCDFPDSNSLNQTTSKTIHNSSTFGDGPENSINYLSSPSKTLPCRSHKSPISKAIGGPCSSVTSPQMSRCESSVAKPQSLSFINSTPNSQNSFSLKSYSGNLKTNRVSPIHFRPQSGILKKSKMHNSDKSKIKRNSLSSEEDTDWKEKKIWVSKSNIKEASSSSSDEVDDDEEDIDDDESFCGDEISSVMQKHGNQRRRLYTSSMERSSSNSYEKETESIWFETLTRALNNNTPSDDSHINSSTIGSTISGLRTLSSEWLSNLWIKFPLVFEDCCSKCRVCITEANYYLSTVNDLSDIGSQFVEMITRVCKSLSTPLFHLGRDHFVGADSLLESHKLTLMQLQETYDKFCNHMEYSTEILDLLKRSTRISHLEPIKPDEKRINLCRHLEKMMKQLFLMYESHCRLLCDLKHSVIVTNKPLKDISNFVKNIADKLSSKIMTSINNKSSPTEDLEAGYITNVSEMENVEQELYKALLIEDIVKVQNIWRLNRVGLVVFNKALESNNPSFYLMQMFCILYAKDNPDLLVYVNAQDINISVDRPQQVSILAASLVPLSSKISDLEKKLVSICSKKIDLMNSIDTEQSIVHVTSDSSVM